MEWQNLKRFAKWGIPTAEVVAWGLERRGAAYDRGAMITRELPHTEDLSALAHRHDLKLADRAWVDTVSRQLAGYTRTMHDHRFTHNDLKWRNLLVGPGDRPTVYWIDCPSGCFWWGAFLQYRIVKDLACLDKVGKYQLTRTQRLRFYLDYARNARLDAADKARIRRILRFFEGRE